MNLYDGLRLAGTILIHWAALAACVSVYLHTRTNWWLSPMGRHLMSYQVVVAMVLVLWAFSLDASSLAGTVWLAVIRLVVFVGVPVVLTQRVWMQWKAQREVKREIGRHREGSPPATDRLDGS